jgi:hypothetical protein
MLKSLVVHLSSEHEMTTAQYKEKWGYNRETGLICDSMKPTFGRMARSLRGGVHRDRHRLVKRLLEMLPAARRTKKRLEYRLDRRDKQKGRARPDLWKKSPDGRVATDLEIARLHLQGVTRTKIAKAVGLKYGESVSARLLRMGFPSGRASIYDRGEPVTGKNLLDLCRDAQWTRTEFAQRLQVSISCVYNRMSPSRVTRSLPVEMAKVLLAVRKGFIEDYRRRGATTRGGRPKTLLASEKASLPNNYHALRQELKLLRGWLLEQSRTPDIGKAWEWLCQQSREGRARTLLFWPRFFRWLKDSLTEGFFLAGNWAPHEVTIDFLAAEYDASEETVRRIIYGPAEERRDGAAWKNEPLTVKLLNGLRTVFMDRPAISSAELVALLNGLKDSSRGQFSLTQPKLADSLRPLGVRSRNVRVADRVVKGYTRKDLEALSQTGP